MVTLIAIQVNSPERLVTSTNRLEPRMMAITPQSMPVVVQVRFVVGSRKLEMFLPVAPLVVALKALVRGDLVAAHDHVIKRQDAANGSQ